MPEGQDARKTKKKKKKGHFAVVATYTPYKEKRQPFAESLKKQNLLVWPI